MTLGRGVKLTPEQIVEYEKMAKIKDEYGSFQSFSSCNRNRKKAEELIRRFASMSAETEKTLARGYRGYWRYGRYSD